MPLIDADAALAALEPFQLTIGGRTYTAKPLSWPEHQRVEQAAAALLEGKLTEAAFEKTLRLALRAAFPARWRYIIRPSEDPVLQILELTPIVRQAVVNGFFDHLNWWKAQRPPEAKPRSSSPNSLAETSS